MGTLPIISVVQSHVNANVKYLINLVTECNYMLLFELHLMRRTIFVSMGIIFHFAGILKKLLLSHIEFSANTKIFLGKRQPPLL